MRAVVIPWSSLESSSGWANTRRSECVCMSMKPGETTWPAASIVRTASPPTRWRIETIRSPWIPTSPRTQGLPDPSTIRPFLITTSSILRSSFDRRFPAPDESVLQLAAVIVLQQPGQTRDRRLDQGLSLVLAAGGGIAESARRPRRPAGIHQLGLQVHLGGGLELAGVAHEAAV